MSGNREITPEYAGKLATMPAEAQKAEVCNLLDLAGQDGASRFQVLKDLSDASRANTDAGRAYELFPAADKVVDFDNVSADGNTGHNIIQEQYGKSGIKDDGKSYLIKSTCDKDLTS